MNNFVMTTNYLQRDGFIMVSNLMVEYQKELKITNKELMFLIKVMKHKENYKLHDSQIDPSLSTRTLQRYRKSLVEKGILTYKIWKTQDSFGRFMTEGITYDLSPLEKKLQSISNKLAEEKNKKIAEEAQNYILEYEEDSPMRKFCEDWEAHYGDKYNITAFEKMWYNSLKSEHQEYLKYIFRLCSDYRLFTSVVPRLSLFAKNKERWKQLKDYVSDVTYVPPKSAWDLRLEKLRDERS